jgi:hypothetical protein
MTSGWGRVWLGKLTPLAALLAASTRAHGQADTTQRDTTTRVSAAQIFCDSVLRAAHVDSVVTQVRGYLVRADGGALAARTRSELMLLVQSYLALPQPMRLPVFASGPARLRMLRPEHLEGDASSARTPVVHGVYGIFLRRGEVTRLDSIRVEVPTLVPGFDSSIVQAVRQTVMDAALAPMLRDVRDLRDDRIALQLRITSGITDVRVPGFPIFSAALPRLRLTDARQAPGNLPPEYPLLERIEGGDGEVLVRVVINDNGRALMPTAEVLHATSPIFAIAALGALSQYRFVPAQVGQCTVPQVLEVPFFFSLRP